MKKVIYAILILVGVYYIYQNFPFKSWEDFTNYVYSGKHLENHVEKSEEQNKEDKKVDLSQQEKQKQINEILGIEENEKPKTFKDKIKEKYEEIKEKIENFVNSVKMFFTNKEKKEE
ncbi:hypothetical protein [Sulfurihydrogenibium azorense]|jgi:biopolymer transport protein ExbB/TolQ|uniref:Uncharacterized protein n=1 Tax=Sulfurihydrogenibium azorense (strain DSM 15241 / OCM 825 / Az-Fu1) TaxID=204536 RepID=C1DUA9_SULAA|nr:hypothetical protein [Sulfurihydrogenibium azorense]ACN98205.1 hypothetical protein SULAZ_0711 [Sulfurihydrogenibium azorense Az-Fu1]MDM7274144.1 hypothetical protein [Sulfurihydrogenibium azorense]